MVVIKKLILLVSFVGEHSENEDYDTILERELNELSEFDSLYIKDMTISDIEIKSVIFSNLLFDYIEFNNVKFIDCSFSQSVLENIDFIDCEIINCDFEYGQMINIKFEDTIVNNLTINRYLIVDFYFMGYQEHGLAANKFKIINSQLYDMNFQFTSTNYLEITDSKVTKFILANNRSDNTYLKNIEFNILSISHSSFRNSELNNLTSIANDVALELCDCYNTEIVNTEILDKKHKWNNFKYEDVSLFYIDLLNYVFEQDSYEHIDELFLSLEKLQESSKLTVEHIKLASEFINKLTLEYKDNSHTMGELFRRYLELIEISQRINSNIFIENPIKSLPSPASTLDNKHAYLEITFEFNEIYFNDIARLFELQTNYFNLLEKFSGTKPKIVSLKNGSIYELIYTDLKQLAVSGRLLGIEKLELENEGQKLTNEILLEFLENLPQKEKLAISKKIEDIKIKKLQQIKLLEDIEANRELLKSTKESIDLDNERKRIEIAEKKLQLKLLAKQMDEKFDLDEFLETKEGRELEKSANELKNEMLIKQIKFKTNLSKYYENS